MTATADSDSESYWQARAQWTGPAAAATTVTGPAARQPGTVSGPGAFNLSAAALAAFSASLSAAVPGQPPSQ